MNVRESEVVANGLRHHVVEWPADGPTVLLAHGFLDLAWSWRWVAEILQGHGLRCVAWDWRGHGETEHIGAGGYYHFPDYVLDLEELLPQLVREDERAHLVGHSMGGTVATMFAGLRSHRLTSLSLVEGLGPPAMGFDQTPFRFDAWLGGVRKQRERTKPASVMSVEDALRRMRVQNPKLDDDKGRFLAEKATAAVDGDPAKRRFRFDRLHRTTSPMPFRLEVFETFLTRISVPTLVVGASAGFRLADEAERAGRIPDARTVEIAECGHMIHWEKPEQLAEHLRAHVAGASSGGDLLDGGGKRG